MTVCMCMHCLGSNMSKFTVSLNLSPFSPPPLTLPSLLLSPLSPFPLSINSTKNQGKLVFTDEEEEEIGNLPPGNRSTIINKGFMVSQPLWTH